jgi:diguanylate cyclase (GGDEF)-like protein
MEAAAWLAQAESAQAAGDFAAALQAAGNAWQAAAEPAQKLRAGLLRTQMQYRSGALAAVVDGAVEVLSLAHEHGTPAERFDLMRSVALAALEGGQFDIALATAHQAHALAQQADDRARQALGMNALACCFERMGDPWQAERMMQDALTLARASGDARALLSTLNNLAAVQIGLFHIMRDAAEPAEARAPLERALPLAREAVALNATVGETYTRIFVEGNLAEVLLYLGELAEARRLIEGALGSARSIGAAAQEVRLSCSLGALQLAEGDAVTAWQTLQRILAESAEADVHVAYVRVHHALWLTARALRRDDAALHHLEQYLRVERTRQLSQLRAQSQMFVTRAEAEQVRLESRRDELTRLGNRREAELRWPEILAEAQRTGAPLAVAMVDLDHFKNINDSHGHAVGDAVLVALAAIVRDNTRVADLVARIGGEEFLVVLPDTPPERAHEVCERLRQRVEAHDWSGAAEGLAVTLSIGLVHAPPYDADALMARADAALYAAKAAGRNRVVDG